MVLGSAKFQVAPPMVGHTVKYRVIQRRCHQNPLAKECATLMENPQVIPDVDREPTVGVWMEKPLRDIGNARYRRFVVRTHLVRSGERLDQTLLPYLKDRVQPGDVVVLGEKIVAIAEGRAILLKSIKPRPVARFLSRHVRQLGYGMGLRRPETMEMAIREVGLGRILMAATIGALDRVVGRSGDFYRIAGRQVAAIDGPGPTTIPPFNQYIVLAPARAQSLVDRLSKKLGVEVAVVDVNDVGSEVLACSQGTSREIIEELLRDNPMGQGSQRTPVGILRSAAPERPQGAWPKLLPPQTEGGYFSPSPGMGDGSIIWVGGEVASTSTDDLVTAKDRHGKLQGRRL